MGEQNAVNEGAPMKEDPQLAALPPSNDAEINVHEPAAGGHFQFLSLDDIWATEDITESPVWVKEWNGYVLVRSISKRQMDIIREGAENGEGELDNRAIEREILIAGLVRPHLPREQFEKMQDKSAGAVLTILNAIVGSSGVREGESKRMERQFPA